MSENGVRRQDRSTLYGVFAILALQDDQPGEAEADQRELVAQRAELEFTRAQAEQLGESERVRELTEQIAQVDEQIRLSGLRGRAVRPVVRRVRSTRRRQDAPNLPRRRVSPRTVGRVYVGRDGREHRPSMFLTLTLPSYGPVRRSDGTPVDMDSYDYRRAALDAIHFPALLDRFWQNLRRCVGWNVQYFGCVEMQRRLAPHAHFAVRGTFPRAVFRQVVDATYHQVWWPPTDVVMFGEDGPQPEWLDHDGQTGYISPWTGELLPTWEQAMDALDAQIEAGTARPVHVVRFGTQAHVGGDHDDEDQGDEHGQSTRDGLGDERPMRVEGVEGGTDKAEKAIAYITKYITKSVDECVTRTTEREIEHYRRFYEALRFTPCSPRCSNWLRYGIQPKGARPGMRAGACRGRVHQPATLGIRGRRILVSREWSGKTLADHKADQRAWVRRILALGQQRREQLNGDHTTTPDSVTGRPADGPQPVDYQADAVAEPRVWWERANPQDPDVRPLHQRLWRRLGERIRQRAEWRAARNRLVGNVSPPPLDVSAIRQRRSA